MSIDMRIFLEQSAGVLCKALNDMLPPLSAEWWGECVKGKLSFQQRQQVDRRGITRLDQLDLAALLRIFDQNWFELANVYKWPYDVRNYVKEMQTVRNRWAHAQVATPAADDIYRDLDTLQRFLTLLNCQDSLLQAVLNAKRTIHETSAEESMNSQQQPSPATQFQFVPGTIVRLKTDPSKTGAVTQVLGGDVETRYQVFHAGKVATYYESQLVPDTPLAVSIQHMPLEAFHARLTALQLLHPSVSNLYSLHAARIEVIPYQFRPVLKFIQSDRPRLLIADSVGVGKTIEAGLILRELQARRDIRRVLIACPRPLVTEEKWRREMKRFDEHFEHLDGPKLRFCISETDLDGQWPERYEKVIIPFSLLNDEALHGKGRKKGLLDLDPPPQFDLVIVDEAHHIRNTETQRHQAIRFLCDNAEAVLFLTATPIQLGDHDLYVLLNTLRPDVIIDEAGYAVITEPNAHINQAALIARKGENDWAEQAREALLRAADTPWGRSVLQRDPQFQNVYDSLANADRERSSRVGAIRDIERLHTLSGLMNRTLRRDIGQFTQRKPETVLVEFTPEQKQLHTAVLAAQAAVYAALHGDRAVNFLLTTIRRQTASCINGLAPLLRGILVRRVDELQWEEITELSDDMIDPDSGVSRIRNLIDDAIRLTEQLDPDPEKDPKFKALRRILDQKQALQNNKVMLFSSFRHTLAYLHEALSKDGYRVGLIHGGVEDDMRVALRECFEKERCDPDALDVLLFSEVGCEGLDYQFCDCIVNYDIPWNPMRIDQRIGRIDRWGQKSEAVAIYNLITPGTVDADIYERCLLRIGVFERALGANEAILGRITQEITSVAESLSLSPAERQAKLDLLADNSIRMFREQQDLEERQTQLFGLRVPLDQFKKDVDQASSYWLSPNALLRLAKQYLQIRTTKEDPVILGESPKKLLRLSRAARDILLADFASLPTRTAVVAREWENWLKGSDPQMVITFDAAYAAEDRNAILITPIHPLVLQAARYMAADPQLPMTCVEVTFNSISQGDYPFAIYQWQYHGIRTDAEFKPITSASALSDQFISLIQMGQSCGISSESVAAAAKDQIEKQHYILWSDARAHHIEQTRRIADFRLTSLKTSHNARMAMIDNQLASAENDRIRIMRAAQKANAQTDYERHLREIEDAVSKADITAEPIAWGIMRVRG
jgi:ATP-dependent helicase HepA